MLIPRYLRTRSCSIALVVFAMFFSLACSGGGTPEGKEATNAVRVDNYGVTHQVLEKGLISRVTAEAMYKFENESQWMSHYSNHKGYLSYNDIPLTTDFTKNAMVAIHLGARSTIGSGINISSVSYDYTDSVIHIRYEEVIDTQNNAPGTCFPYAFFAVSPKNMEFRFIKQATVYK